jgi:hypothetical protein
MKNSHIAVAIALSSLLVGCDEGPPSPEEEKAYVEEQAAAQVRQTLASDQQDLKDTIAELQKKDPSVKDAYYSINEKGEKELHVVRETADGQRSDSAWPLLGGMATGYLLARAMSAGGGVSNYSQSYPPASSNRCDKNDQRRCQNSGGSAYTTMLMNNARNSVRSSPSFKTDMTSKVLTTRSTGIMANRGGGSGARGVAVSGG